MKSALEARIAYGRDIRSRAEMLVEAHGAVAEAEAREAARIPGTAAADRFFWEAVADRVARMRGEPVLPTEY
jgi:hypothetical protein